MKYRNIVVAGDVGTGTTTLAKALAKKFGWKYTSAGDFFRSYATTHNIELWDKASVPDEIERRLDSELTEKLKNENGWVVDSHYAGWFVRDQKDIFKILLICDRSIANIRMQEREHTHKETEEEVEKRRSGLYAKFKKLYSEENYEDPKLFDLIIDTTNNTPEEPFQKALTSLNSS